MRTLVLFDFDGTITDKDSFIALLKFHVGTFQVLLGFVLFGPWVVGYYLRLYPNHKLKSRIIRYFFGGMTIADFEALGVDFCRDKVPFLIRRKALKEIEKWKSRGAEIYIVSVSIEEWIKPWPFQHGCKVIGTRLEYQSGYLTG